MRLPPGFHEGMTPQEEARALANILLPVAKSDLDFEMLVSLDRGSLLRLCEAPVCRMVQDSEWEVRRVYAEMRKKYGYDAITGSLE